MPAPPPPGRKALAVSRRAAADMDEILDYLTRSAGADTAARFAGRLDAELLRIAWIGHSGVPRESIAPDLRMTMIASFNVYFRLTDQECRIVRVLRSKRDLDGVSFD
jgi:plasmid stabilization system protein ParE